MNAYLIECWNSRIKKNDIVYHLGDFGWDNKYMPLEQIANDLNGQIFLIEGSHDWPARRFENRFIKIVQQYNIGIKSQRICMSHCAMLVWERSHYGAWNLFGHSHGRLSIDKLVGKQMDVGVDTHNFLPYTFEEIRDIMIERKDNWNLINKEAADE